ncbi:MAG: PH domain-containing protein [Clostridiales bacterium]|jgi:hypothetical protein|nr:PH domain-containing protein [Clostridiales bacterium]
MRYPSAKDLWFKIIIFPSFGILIGSVFIVPSEFFLLTFVSVIPVVLFLAWIYFGTYYELHEDYLLCKSGPFREKIRYDNIKSLKLSRNLLASMALSSKRIEIRQHGKNYITGTTLISPENREEFLAELKSRCKNLEE